MRDATQNIIDSLKELLNNLSYNGTKFAVVDTVPESSAFHHVWIKGVKATSEGTKDKNIQRIVLDIEVVSGGKAQKGSLTAINYISDQILYIIEDLQLNGFYVVIKPEMISYQFLEERAQHENQTIIINRKQLSFEMLIQELWK